MARPALNKDGSHQFVIKPDGQPLLEKVQIGDRLIDVPVKKYLPEVTPTQVDVGANVVHLPDGKKGEVIHTTGYIATVKFADGSQKAVHFGRLMPGEGAVGE